MKNKWKFLIIVFFTGISVTVLEIASARLIAPYFGSTIYVWGGAIGTVLFALAVGYWFGGKIIDRRPTTVVLSVVLLVAATTTMLIPWTYQVTTYGLSHLSSAQHVPVSIGVIVTMLMLFFIPLVAMGMVSPIVLRISEPSLESVGSWSGSLSGMATFGSIVGTFVAAYGTIPLIGTRWSIYGASLLLFLIAGVVAIPKKKVTILVVLLALATSVNITFQPFVTRAGVIAEKESAYQLVQVIQQGHTRFLVHDAGFGVQSLYTPGTTYTKSLYDVFGLLPYMTTGQGKHRSVLLLGLGGGNIIRLLEKHLGDQFTFDVTAVEIDPVVVDMARQHFDLDQLQLHLVIDDARHYLRTEPTKYDLIIVDAYTHEMQIPTMLATQEFFQEVHNHIAPGGLLGINAAAFPNSRFLPKFLSTIRAVFPDVREAGFTPGSASHFVVAGEQLDPNLVPTKLDSILQPYRDSALAHLKPIQPGGDIYTDDKTDLDLRVKPILQ